MKDKTGLGLGWGRTSKEGRGPRVLRSVWRDWAEAEEFKTRWEMLSQEEVERREIERERASRRVTSWLFFSLSTSCGSWLILGCVVFLEGCGEKRRNCRVRPGRRGYDTSVSLGCFPHHLFSFFFGGGLACVNHLLLALQCKPLALKKTSNLWVHRWSLTKK